MLSVHVYVNHILESATNHLAAVSMATSPAAAGNSRSHALSAQGKPSLYDTHSLRYATLVLVVDYCNAFLKECMLEVNHNSICCSLYKVEFSPFL